MISWLKKIKGYVRIKVWGFSPERFMNLCSNKNILLWDIVKQGDVYTMCISLSGFYQLRPIARKTGTRVMILGRYGLPFFVPVILARKIFVAGLILCVGFWMWSSLYIWDIELSGNYQITQDVFDSFLKNNDIHIGMKKDELDIEALEKEIRRQFSAVTWTSAKLNGTKLNIDIKENEAPAVTAVRESEGGRDLVAEYEGVVVSIMVRSGVPKVVAGDTVESGTLLVEGKVPVYNEDATVREYQYVESDADIYIRHVATCHGKLPFDHVDKEYTGRVKKQYYLRFGEKELSLPQKDPFLIYDCLIRESRPALFEKLSIPVAWGARTYREYQNVEYEYTVSEAEELLQKQISDFLASLAEKGVQIIEKNVRIDTDNGMWVVDGEFAVIEKAGKLVDTPVEEIPEAGENQTDE